MEYSHKPRLKKTRVFENISHEGVDASHNKNHLDTIPYNGHLTKKDMV
jgi:hypothetical protein